MSRPFLVIFLTIFVHLVGFGIIIPLLPFYAQTFGASPFLIGLLFASFSVSQLVAAPVLGDWSDKWGRRPVLLFSLIGTVVSFVMMALATNLTILFLSRIVDGLSGGNISTARAYIADITEGKDRARAYGLIGAAFSLGFILGPGLAGVFSHVSYTAPIWLAAALSAVATILAWVWLPETVHRAHAGGVSPFRVLPQLLRRANLSRLLGADLLYWSAFGVYQATFALFGQIRFGFDAPQVGYILTASGILGVFVQGVLVGRVVAKLGEKKTMILGLALAAFGLGAASQTHSVLPFLLAIVPSSIGSGLGLPALTALLSRAADPKEQGRVQGAAGALESLGRAIGPVWGNSALQRFGEGSAYLSAAVVLLLTALVAVPYEPPVRRDT